MEENEDQGFDSSWNCSSCCLFCIGSFYHPILELLLSRIFPKAALWTTVYGPSVTENSENETRVYGTIKVSEPDVKFDDATVYVRIIDALMQDAPSILLTMQVIQNASYDSNSNNKMIRFSIPITFDVQERRDYYVSAHVDLDGDKSASSGDYVTMTSHPVLANGFLDERHLVLEKVR